MTHSTESKKQLWLILAGLALAIVLVIVIDFLPGARDSQAETPDTAPDSSALTTASQDESTQEVLAHSDPAAFTLTFLGECAPGSPYGTSAYNSLNALAAEVGTSYFFSAIAPLLAEDNLTVAANRCVFSDEIDAECAAPLANASIYADASVELVLNLSPSLDDHMVQASLPIQNTGVFVIRNDTVYTTGNENLRITILTTRLTSESAEVLAETVFKTKKTTDYLVLYFYGGEVNSHIPEDWMTDILHDCADAGADLIVGTGTGVLRPAETYNGVPIAYSLGGLIDGTQLVPENAGAIMQCTVRKNDDGTIESDISYIPVYVYTELWQPAVMTDTDDAERVRDFLDGKLSMPIEVRPN